MDTNIPFQNPRSEVRQGVLLKRYTSWGIGGTAKTLILPADSDDLILALNHIKAFRIIGNGANLLIADREFEEPIIVSRRCSNYTVLGTHYIVETGMLLPVLAGVSAKNGHSGLEFAAGIPGTVGGACMMNAGAHGQEWKTICDRVAIWEKEKGVRMLEASECRFGYRTSAFQKMGGRVVIVRAELNLAVGQPDEILRRQKENLKWRKSHTPFKAKSCGSVFKRGDSYFPGALIEQAGCKGWNEGDAEVSVIHANYFINKGHATFEQMKRLIERVEKAVFDKFQVRLEREMIVWE